jgi:pimeloyl-ACP methyl ester carboxylesterase
MDEDRYREAERRLWNFFGVTPTERRVTLEQYGIKVRIQEVGSGPATLFLHGGPNSGSTWAHWSPVSTVSGACSWIGPGLG